MLRAHGGEAVDDEKKGESDQNERYEGKPSAHLGRDRIPFQDQNGPERECSDDEN